MALYVYSTPHYAYHFSIKALFIHSVFSDYIRFIIFLAVTLQPGM